MESRQRPTAGRKRPLAALGGFLVPVAAVALVDARFSTASGWYAELHKPSFQPPGWLFGPVWTALYILMAISAWRVWWTAASPGRTRALRLWVAQLLLNALWPLLFFGLHAPSSALWDEGALLLLVLLYTCVAARVERLAALLMAPYLAWLCFAGVLNLEILLLN